jgi:hypothetical protein
MANILLENPAAVLIHIPKTGVQSIHKLWGARKAEVQKGFIPPEWDDLFKFAFVRHPFDRLVSTFYMFNNGVQEIGEDGIVIQERVPIFRDPLTFEQFCDKVLYENDIERERWSVTTYTLPQTNTFNCLENADFVGRFERFEADFNKLSRHFKKELPTLPRVNVSKRDKGWEELMAELPSDVYDKMYEYYREDFKELKYENVSSSEWA